MGGQKKWKREERSRKRRKCIIEIRNSLSADKKEHFGKRAMKCERWTVALSGGIRRKKVKESQRSKDNKEILKRKLERFAWKILIIFASEIKIFK